MKNKNFRLFVAPLAALALLLASCGSSSTGDKPATETGQQSSSSTAGGAVSKPKVAILFTQFVDQGNWDVAGYAAYKAMCDKYDFDCSYMEQATYERAPALLRQYGQENYAMVITHSSGYAAAIEEVAPEFPKTQYVLFSYATDTHGLSNFSAWSVDFDQAGYLQGIIAGIASKDGKVAVVGAEKIPSSLREVSLIQKGVEVAKPGAKVTTVWTGSFVDVAKAKQVTEQAVNSGVDFIVPVIDLADQGVYQAAEEHGIHVLAEYMDESAKAPNAIVTSVVIDMKGAYDQMGDLLTKNGLHGQIVQMNAASGAFSFAPFHNVDDSVANEAKAKLADLANGTLTVPNIDG